MPPRRGLTNGGQGAGVHGAATEARGEGGYEPVAMVAVVAAPCGLLEAQGAPAAALAPLDFCNVAAARRPT